MGRYTRRKVLGLGAALAAGTAAGPAEARDAWRRRRAGGRRDFGPAREREPGPRRWLAGDLHSHTVLSHDVWGGPGDDNTDLDEAYTLGFTAAEQIANAEQRGLDFLAITDHNRTDALRLAEYRSEALTLLPAYEHSLEGGHAGVFVPDRAQLADIVRDGDGSTAFEGDDAAGRFLDRVHSLGGIAVLNHPFYGNEDQGEALSWGYGLEVSRRFDAVEVWNIGWPARHDLLPFADSDNYLSLPWWEREIASRRRVGIVGGSDSHWRLTALINGVGQPTTWAHARNRQPAGVLDAIRQGRTSISSQPPQLGGARLMLSATETWAGGQEAGIGDDVRARGPLVARLRVLGGAGNRLRLVSMGMVVAEETVTRPDASYDIPVVLEEGGWLRAELFLDEGYFMTALTSPIYARGLAPARRRARPSDGDIAAYGHPTKRHARPTAVTRLRRSAGCSC